MQIPKTVDPIKLAKQKTQLSGEISLATCARLQEIADQKNNHATVDLTFGQDEARIYFIRGNIHAMVNVICQRCNSSMPLEMDVSFLLSPVVSEEHVKKLPNQYEPIVMADDHVNLCEAVEDEILLALPMIPKHEQCTLTPMHT
ncbi:MAG: hypothetical protein A3C44_05140 [Gammaproteobacteria bacterium RIFCSPHIGHO2_02_FULL_39_13]|nr:MAG: hypothetical protein A3C44_05140 [Gammaproteobacteria bacterium RIFCSPHIGHO2_02_FULL_39_13]OGT48726.1 MAG: hypothetical protein A3E53_05590 [Gammaproteobacteria bacterium RIFCSPHIGHO2_12_FULL_39_24]